VYARTTPTELQFKLVTNGNILNGPMTGGDVNVYVDVDQNSATNRCVGTSLTVNDTGPDLIDSFGVDDGSDGVVVAANTYVMSFPLHGDSNCSVLPNMPPTHRSVSVVLTCFDDLTTDTQTIPVSGHLTYQVR
jgi:hypothetical protein